jgi:hypothetical protein
VFKWLNSLTVCQVIEQTMPILFHSAIINCMKKSTQMGINEITEPLFEIAVDKMAKITNFNSLSLKLFDFENYRVNKNDFLIILFEMHFFLSLFLLLKGLDFAY